MEVTLIYVLLGLIVVLLVVQRPLKRALNRKAAAKGRELGMNYGEQMAEKITQKSLNSALSKVATVLVAPMAAEPKLREILSASKKVQDVDANTWHFAFSKPDDLLLRWEAGSDYGTLRVVKTLEMLNEPIGDHQWLRFLKSTERTLNEAGFETTRQPGNLQRQVLEKGTDAIWVATE